MLKLNFVITFILIAALLPSISCQQGVEVSHFELFRNDSIKTDTFYIDDEAINLTVEFSKNIADLTIDMQCIYVMGEEENLLNTTIVKGTRRITNTKTVDISLYRTDPYWPRGSYLIVLSLGKRELIRVPFDVVTPIKPVLNIETADDRFVNEKETRTYFWEYKGREFQYDFKYSKSLYEYYANKPRFSMRDPHQYAIYATDPYDDDFINNLAIAFMGASETQGFDQFETLGLITDFIQSLPRVPDRAIAPYEYPKYPVQTLQEEGGDCEDTSILLSSILDAMGIMTVLLIYPTHCAVGVGATGVQGKSYQHEGIDYYYLESSNPGWTLGRIPQYLDSIDPSIVPLVPLPHIVHTIVPTELGRVLRLDVEVLNLGSANSGDIQVIAYFETNDTGSNYFYQESGIFNISTNQKAHLLFYLDFPLEAKSLIVKTIHEGELSYSDRIDVLRKPYSSK